MKRKPKVSVLIPLFNSNNFIAQTLKSAINQTWTNIEIIIVDDGSSDNSYQIAKSFESKKVKVFQQKNKGACAARNNAFEKSNGDLIQFLDADDLLSPKKLEEQIKLFKQFGNNIVTNCKWGRFTANYKDVKWEHQPINKNYDCSIDWLTDSWMGNGMAQTAVWLTPRRLIDKAGAWDESLEINQDGDFFARVLMHAQAIKFVPDVGVYYRSGHSHSITQYKPQSRAKAESLLKSFQSYTQVLSIKDTPDLRKALGNNFLNYIYQFYSLYPDLSLIAEKSFKDLGFKKMWPVGGRKFKHLSKLIGIKNALYISKFIK